MKAAVIPSSDLLTFGRMDPAFHLAHLEAKPRIQELEKALSVEQAGQLGHDLLAAMPASQASQALSPLRRGPAGRAANKEELHRLVRDYPWFALARLEACLEPAMAATAAQIQELQEQLQNLSTLRARLPSVACARPPKMG